MAYYPKKMLIIDGYNVLRSGNTYTQVAGEAPNFEDWQDETFNKARETLLNDVAIFAGKDYETIVVFDAQNNPKNSRNSQNNHSPQFFGRIKIIFSDYGKSADSTIEQLVINAANKGVQTTVVTSDSCIQNVVMKKNVVRMSANEFCRTVAGDHYSTKANLATDVKIATQGKVEVVSKTTTSLQKIKSTYSATVEKRVSPEILEKLRSLRDSL